MRNILLLILLSPLFANSQSRWFATPNQLKQWNDSLGIGVQATSPFTIGNTTCSTCPAPQVGTLLHIISEGTVNGRISHDTYNGSSVVGSIFQGRRAAGTANSPSAAIADYTLAAFSGDGYGTTGFHNISLGGLVIKSEGTMTDASAPTYLTLLTTPTGSITAAERLRVKSNGTINIAGLNSVGFVQTNSSGDLSTAALTSGNITTALGYTPVTNARTVNGQALSSDVTISTITGNAGTATTLQTARNINGASFNGSADVVTDMSLLAYQALGSPFLGQTVDFPLQKCNTATSLTDNQLRITAVYLPKAATLTGIKVYVRTLGSYTADQNNRVGLYSYSGGTLTLVASSANSGTLWTSAANAIQTIPFSSTYAASAGIYFVAVLYNSSAQTTAPGLASGTALNNLAMAGVAYGFTNSAKLNGTVATQNDLPATQAMSGVTATTVPLWAAVY